MVTTHKDETVTQHLKKKKKKKAESATANRSVVLTTTTWESVAVIRSFAKAV